MSGHSKWHSIKHAKGAADAARGKQFARLARQIEVAARSGGGDVDANPTLRTMVQKELREAIFLVQNRNGQCRRIVHVAVVEIHTLIDHHLRRLDIAFTSPGRASARGSRFCATAIALSRSRCGFRRRKRAQLFSVPP